MNKYGERGSPWWIPLVGLKKRVGAPLISIEIVDEVMHDIINLIKFVGKLKYMSVSLTKLHSSLSNIFSRFNFKRNSPCFPFFFLKWWIIS